MSLKRVIPLTSEQLASLDKARKDLDHAQEALDAIEKEIIKPYDDKPWPWSASVDGGFILIRRHD